MHVVPPIARPSWRAIAVAWSVIVAASAFASGACRADDATAPLVLERSIPLAQVSGRIDHMAVDLKRRRLIVAELGNDTVDVIDLASGKVVHRFDGLKEPQGVAYLPDSDLIVVANGGDGSVNFYGADFSAVRAVPLGEDADNVRLDHATGRLVVGHGDGMLAVIDPAHASVLSDIALAAHPEGFQLAPQSRRAFVNVPDAREVAVVDFAAGRQESRWRFPNLADNYPMAIDGTGGLIAIAFRTPPRLVLAASGNGTVTGSYPTCGDADDVFFDAGHRRIYVSCGAGAVDVFELESANARHMARVPTFSGARTSLFVPEMDRLFVAARAGLLGKDAAILVFRPRP
jgi:hypothetical protein